MCTHVHYVEEGTLGFTNFTKGSSYPHKNETLIDQMISKKFSALMS